MKASHQWMKQIAKLGVLLLTVVSMGAEAGLFGSGDFSWKEEILLHDGRQIIVKRSQSYGGQREPGQSPPIKEHVLTFQLPGSGKTIKWVSEFSQDVRRANFDLLALHVLNDTPYIVAEPNLCLAFNKWGRPNPPYVIFRYDGAAWQRITLSELPNEFIAINVIINVRREEDIERAALQLGYAPADAIKKLNSGLNKSILREALPNARSGCIKTDYYGNAGWLSPDWFTDQSSLAACLKFCDYKKIGTESCPCNAIFKGK